MHWGFCPFTDLTDKEMFSMVEFCERIFKGKWNWKKGDWFWYGRKEMSQGQVWLVDGKDYTIELMAEEEEYFYPLPLIHQWMASHIFKDWHCYISIKYCYLSRYWVIEDDIGDLLTSHVNPHYACFLIAKEIDRINKITKGNIFDT